LLRRAIAERKDFAFETTLGANTILRMLREAVEIIEIFVWYVGLASAQLHIDRVAARVRRGGHAIAQDLIELMPHLTELRVYDNSIDADPASVKTPELKLLLHVKRCVILNLRELNDTPDWANPIVSTALKLYKARR
jgi:predicted ABC-type ATPase